MCSRLEQVWSESGADGEQMNTRALLSFRGLTVDDYLPSTMTQRPGSQIHGVAAARRSVKDDIPRESACHPRMHEAEARGLSQAAVHLQCTVQKG